MKAELLETIERSPDGLLSILKDGGRVSVRLARCFPWSEPGRFFSLRDEKEDEVALIPDLDRLSPATRGVVEEALAEAGFVLEIEQIESHEEEIELRNWQVRTRQGARKFQTKLDAWPRPVPGGGLLIKDVAGDLFYVKKPDRLDAKSRAILWAYLD